MKSRVGDLRHGHIEDVKPRRKMSGGDPSTSPGSPFSSTGECDAPQLWANTPSMRYRGGAAKQKQMDDISVVTGQRRRSSFGFTFMTKKTRVGKISEVSEQPSRALQNQGKWRKFLYFIFLGWIIALFQSPISLFFGVPASKAGEEKRPMLEETLSEEGEEDEVNQAMMVGQKLYKQGRFQDAILHWIIMKDACEKKYGCGSVHAARVGVELGRANRRLNRLEQAIAILQDSADKFEAVEGRDGDGTTNARREIGIVNVHQGQRQKALEIFSDIISTLSKKQVQSLECKVNIARTRSELALVLREMGDYAEALAELTAARQIFSKECGESHLLVQHAQQYIDQIKAKLRERNGSCSPALGKSKFRLPALLTPSISGSLGALSALHQSESLASSANSTGKVSGRKSPGSDMNSPGSPALRPQSPSPTLRSQQSRMSPVSLKASSQLSWTPATPASTTPTSQLQSPRMRPSLMEAIKPIEEGKVLWLQKDYFSALALYDQGLAVYLRLLGRDHVNVANTRVERGMLLTRLDRRDKALEEHNEALRIYLAAFGKEHVVVARVLGNIGGVYLSIRQYEKALDHFKRALEILTFKLGPMHADVGLAMCSLALALRKQGDMAGSADNYEQAIDIVYHSLGCTSLRVADIRCEAGTVHWRMKNFASAITHFEKALETYKHRLGDKDETVLALHCTIGTVYLQDEEFEMAAEHLQSSIVCHESVELHHQPREPRGWVADAYSGLGAVNFHRGEYNAAVGMHLKALRLMEKQGFSMKKVADARHEIALVLWKMEKHDEAMIELEKSVAAFNKMYGSENVHSALVMRDMATVIWSAGRTEEGLEWQARSMSILTAINGPVHPQVAECNVTLGKWYREMGALQQALDVYRDALKVFEEIYGADDSQCADLSFEIFKLVQELESKGENVVCHKTELAPVKAGSLSGRRGSRCESDDRAEPSRCESDDRAEPLDESGTSPGTLNIMATAWKTEGNLENAQENYASMVELLQNQKGLFHVETGMAMAELADCLEQQGMLREAFERYKECSRIFEKVCGKTDVRYHNVMSNAQRLLQSLGDVSPIMSSRSANNERQRVGKQ